MSDNRLRRILFVDDDPNILTALKRQLRRKFEIETCDDSTRALDLIESQGPFAVVISDLRMKGIDGLEFLKLATNRNPDGVCIILTGFADLDVAVQAVNNGQIFRFLTKPCPPEVLQQALTEALSHFDQNLRLASR
jgi:DNA-binding NtrC family response regulator